MTSDRTVPVTKAQQLIDMRRAAECFRELAEENAGDTKTFELEAEARLYVRLAVEAGEVHPRPSVLVANGLIEHVYDVPGAFLLMVDATINSPLDDSDKIDLLRVLLSEF